MLTNDGGKVATRAGPQFYALQDHMQHARETNHDWQHFCTQTPGNADLAPLLAADEQSRAARETMLRPLHGTQAIYGMEEERACKSAP